MRRLAPIETQLHVENQQKIAIVQLHTKQNISRHNICAEVEQNRSHSYLSLVTCVQFFNTLAEGILLLARSLVSNLGDIFDPIK